MNAKNELSVIDINDKNDLSERDNHLKQAEDANYIVPSPILASDDNRSEKINPVDINGQTGYQSNDRLEIDLTDPEKIIGKLFLGKEVFTGNSIHIPISAMKRHILALGSNGSGKTFFSKKIIEEATRNSIPSILVDPKGDLSTLVHLRDESDVIKDGIPLRILEEFSSKVEVRIFTPVKRKGIPISINTLKPLPDNLDHDDRIVAIDSLASSIVRIMGYDLSKKNSRSETVKWLLAKIIGELYNRGMCIGGFDKLADYVIEPESLFDDNFLEQIPRMISDKERIEISRLLRIRNTGIDKLIFNYGVPIDIDLFLTPVEEGKVPINIIYLNTFTNDELKQTFVAHLANTLYTWMLKNPSTDVQLLFYIDEVAPYLPPHPYNPPAKEPLKRLFKLSRSFGISCMMATQSPTDVDYKAAGQTNSKIIGRFFDPREKEKIRGILMEGKLTMGSEVIINKLHTLKPGEFFFLCPDVYRSTILMKGGNLCTEHGNVVEEFNIPELIPDSHRKFFSRYYIGNESGSSIHSPSGFPEINTPVIDEKGIHYQEDLVNVIHNSDPLDDIVDLNSSSLGLTGSRNIRDETETQCSRSTPGHDEDNIPYVPLIPIDVETPSNTEENGTSHNTNQEQAHDIDHKGNVKLIQRIQNLETMISENNLILSSLKDLLSSSQTNVSGEVHQSNPMSSRSNPHGSGDGINSDNSIIRTYSALESTENTSININPYGKRDSQNQKDFKRKSFFSRNLHDLVYNLSRDNGEAFSGMKHMVYGFSHLWLITFSILILSHVIDGSILFPIISAVLISLFFCFNRMVNSPISKPVTVIKTSDDHAADTEQNTILSFIYNTLLPTILLFWLLIISLSFMVHWGGLTGHSGFLDISIVATVLLTVIRFSEGVVLWDLECNECTRKKSISVNTDLHGNLGLRIIRFLKNMSFVLVTGFLGILWIGLLIGQIYAPIFIHTIAMVLFSVCLFIVLSGDISVIHGRKVKVSH